MFLITERSRGEMRDERRKSCHNFESNRSSIESGRICDKLGQISVSSVDSGWRLWAGGKEVSAPSAAAAGNHADWRKATRAGMTSLQVEERKNQLASPAESPAPFCLTEL